MKAIREGKVVPRLNIELQEARIREGTRKSKKERGKYSTHFIR
jgi:hypothetical protein